MRRFQTLSPGKTVHGAGLGVGSGLGVGFGAGSGFGLGSGFGCGLGVAAGSPRDGCFVAPGVGGARISSQMLEPGMAVGPIAVSTVGPANGSGLSERAADVCRASGPPAA